MDNSKRVVKNTGILYARMAITVLIALYTTRLTLAVLGAENYGLFGLIGGAISLLGFLNASLASATQRFMSFAQGAGEIGKLKRIFNMSIILHMATAILVLVLLEIGGHIYFNGILNIPANRMEVASYIYQFMVASMVFTIISVPYDAIITSHENMTFIAFMAIIESVLKLLIVFAIGYSSFDHLLSYGALMAALPVFLLIIRVGYCHWRYQECTLRPVRHFDTILLRQMTSFGAWSFLGAASTMITNYGQGIILNMFFGTAINAAQGVANQLNGQLIVLSTNMLKALNPLIDKSAGAGNQALMLKATMMGSKLSFFLIMALHIPVLIEMPYILELWLKNIPDSTVMFCRLLLVRSLVEHLFFPLVSAIAAVGNIRPYQLASSLLTLLPLPVTYYLFQLGFPAYYIYVVFLVYAIFASVIIFYYTVKNCGLPVSTFLFNVLFRCWLSFSFVFGLSCLPYIYLEPSLWRCIYTALTSSLSYLLIVYLFGFSPGEKQQITALLSTILIKLRIKKCSA
ncbi:hypothetical protein KEF85_15535 [Methylomonas paludis]|uniref:Na+-driven multidrug efflux pump n=1 Tax=Methylomonas paludis TaxID=1173101 RepID=A0A975R950_9GAMM|nr:hypothetical protein [Methylomonas paludis]QWF70712.1 hypothetical protein KEF85_15535 [Methylomonas paludis]